MSYKGPLAYVGPGAVPPGKGPLVPIEPDFTDEQLRRAAIGKRANALKRAGYYKTEDVLLILAWVDGKTWVIDGVKQAMTFDEIEQVLTQAEDLCAMTPP